MTFSSLNEAMQILYKSGSPVRLTDRSYLLSEEIKHYEKLFEKKNLLLITSVYTSLHRDYFGDQVTLYGYTFQTTNKVMPRSDNLFDEYANEKLQNV